MTGSPILLLHGIQSAASTWWRVGPDLASLDFMVVTLDLPGHGGAPAPASPTVAGLAEAVSQQLTEPVFVVGHSLGAIVALVLAASRPDLVHGVLLEDPPSLGGGLRTVDVAGDLPGSTAEAREDPAGLAARLLHEHPTWSRADAEHAVVNRAALDLAAAEALVAHEHWDLPALIAAVHVPVTVLAATPPESALTEPDRAAVLAMCPHRIVDSGHGIHRDRPGVWVATVAEAASSFRKTAAELGDLPERRN